jgi:flagellar basal body-associated protein FliL
MKLPKKNKKIPKIYIIILIILIVLSGIYVAFAHFNKSWPFIKTTQTNSVNTIDLNPPTKQQTDTGSDIKNTTTKSDPVSPQTGQVSLSITSVNQNSDTLQIRILIQAVTNSGSCSLTLAKGTSLVSKTAGVQPQSSASTCTGFDVPINELPSGTWQLTVNFKNDTLNGSTSQTIKIK